MKLTTTTQRGGPPANKPVVVDPVLAALNIPVYYDGSGTPELVNSPIFCARLYAECVLHTVETWCMHYHFALVHVGVYNPRMARLASGQEIVPARWSNHAYGCAMDFKGIMENLGTGSFVGTAELIANSPAKYNELIAEVEKAIAGAGHKPEILHEGGVPGWTHLGIWTC